MSDVQIIWSRCKPGASVCHSHKLANQDSLSIEEDNSAFFHHFSGFNSSVEDASSSTVTPQKGIKATRTSSMHQSKTRFKSQSTVQLLHQPIYIVLTPKILKCYYSLLLSVRCSLVHGIIYSSQKVSLCTYVIIILQKSDIFLRKKQNKTMKLRKYLTCKGYMLGFLTQRRMSSHCKLTGSRVRQKHAKYTNYF